jgi:hypothetical protein
VTITGTGFLTGATVSLGGTAATGVTVVSSTSITATTAAHTAGAVNVVVTNADTQSGTLTNGYTYATVAPQINSISPTSGVVGTQVTVNGSGFQATRGAGSVSFNSWFGSVVSWSDTQIVATVPSGATTGPVKVVQNGMDSNTNVIFTHAESGYYRDVAQQWPGREPGPDQRHGVWSDSGRQHGNDQ